jgi:transposase
MAVRDRMYPDAQAETIMRDLHCAHAGEVFVPKCGWARFRWTRPLPAKLGMARVTMDRAGRWHVSFPAPQPAIERKPSGTAVGIDRGVRTALVTSGGQHYRAPRISDLDAARYLGLQHRLARQQKGSRKRDKTRQAMAKITARAKAGLNRGILAACWGILGRRLEQKAAASGGTVTYADPNADYADVNAARNILARGLVLATGEIVPAHALGHGAPRPRKTAQAAAGTTRSAA